MNTTPVPEIINHLEKMNVVLEDHYYWKAG